MPDNKPVKEFRAGKIKAAIWTNQKQTDRGEITIYSVSITKSIKEDGKDWREVNTYFPEELPKLELVTRAAFGWISLRSE